MRQQTYKMRYFKVLLLCCLLEQAACRPQAKDYKDAEAEEYETDDAPEDAPASDDDAVDEKASVKDEDEVAEPHHSRNYFSFKRHGANRNQEERTTKQASNGNFAELRASPRIEGPEDEASDNEQEQAPTDKRYERYNEPSNPKNQFIRELVNQRELGVLRSLQLVKRKDNPEQEESTDAVYDESDQEHHIIKNDKNKRFDENGEPVEQSNFYNYYNRPQAGESEDDPYESEVNHEDANRERRDANDPEEGNGNARENIDKKDFDNFDNDAEQAIIQRYVKKLNKKEVENLMRTLSDDKRAILEQIIGNEGTNQALSLNKREITKKAEAVAENNFMDGVQSDANKISGSLLNFNTENGVTKNDDPTGMTPAIDEHNIGTIVQKSDNKIVRRSNDGTTTDKSENDAATTTSTEPLTSKSENKREVNFNEPEGSPDNSLVTNESEKSSFVGLQDEPYASSQDEDLAQLMNDDAQLHYDYRNPQKRELLESNMDEQEPMKALEESFSDPNSYENAGYMIGSNLMPLIRVKRKNKEHAVKKRAAAVLPDLKVAYVPENEDEDNDEGNEIYDNGFFDRTASFAKSNIRVDKVSDSREKGKLNTDSNPSVFKRSNAEETGSDDIASDTMSIGSDTDSVLSGVEGVNENLMYSGGSRKKRAVEKVTKLEPVKVDMLPIGSRSSSLMGDTARPEIFGVSFDSNDDDTFGTASKSYDGELSRYKRIRRLKQQSSTKEAVE